MAYLRIDDINLHRVFKVYEHKINNLHYGNGTIFLLTVLLAVPPRQLDRYRSRIERLQKGLRFGYVMHPYTVPGKTLQYWVDNLLLDLYDATFRPKPPKLIPQYALCPEIFP